jgi:transcriptional regulator GlxA family with amidase domain
MIGSSQSRPRTFAFLLVDGFALMSFASAVEPLRAANTIAERELYRTICVSLDGEPATSSVGAQMPCQARVGDSFEADTLLICVGGRPWDFRDKKTLGWIRQLSRRGVRIGGVSGGPYVLARAGIMEGRHMTVHWEHAPALSEEYPDLLLTRSRYIIDRDRLTCAGGIAALDMMHAIIAEEHGKVFATQVSDWYLHREVALASSPQRASLTQRYGIHRQDIIYALELMESNIATPLDRGGDCQPHRAVDPADRPAVRQPAGVKLRRSLPHHPAGTGTQSAASVNAADHRSGAGVRLCQCQPLLAGLFRHVRHAAAPRQGCGRACMHPVGAGLTCPCLTGGGVEAARVADLAGIDKAARPAFACAAHLVHVAIVNPAACLPDIFCRVLADVDPHGGPASGSTV